MIDQAWTKCKINRSRRSVKNLRSETINAEVIIHKQASETKGFYMNVDLPYVHAKTKSSICALVFAHFYIALQMPLEKGKCLGFNKKIHKIW